MPAFLASPDLAPWGYASLVTNAMRCPRGRNAFFASRAVPAAWGSCAECAPCPADLDDASEVGGADLELLLGAWAG